MDITAILYEGKKPVTSEELYFAGLDCMVKGENQQAIELFTACVREDSEQADAYLRLAGLFRKKGDLHRAARIYSDLLLRSSIPVNLLQEAERRLVETFQQEGRWNEALARLQRAVQKKPKEAFFFEEIVKCYKAMQLWEEAAAALRQLAKITGKKQTQQEQQLRVKTAEDLSATKPKAALRILHDIIKSNPEITETYLAAIPLSLEYDNQAASRKLLKDYLLNCPEEACTRLPMIEKGFFETGDFSEVFSLYLELSHKDFAGKWRVEKALAENFLKIGRLDTAREHAFSSLDNLKNDPLLELQLRVRYWRNFNSDESFLEKDLSEES